MMESSQQICEGAVSHLLLKIEVNPDKDSKRKYFSLWQYGLWNFQTGSIKLKRFLHKNQYTPRNYCVLKIGLLGASEVLKNQSFENQLFSSFYSLN